MRGALVLAALLLAAVAASLFYGQVRIGPALLWQGLLSGEGPGALMLGTIRGPRVATALGAGAALGLSGGLFQTLFRNPLAAPDMMGFTWGAGLAVTAAVAFHIGLPTPIIAAAGGLATAALVAAFAYRPGHETPPLTLVLLGIAVGYIASALSSFLITILPPSEATEAQRWLAGSLAARDWSHVAQVWLPGSLLALAALGLARPLAVLELGTGLATGLGIRVERARWTIALIAVLLAAVAVAVAGPVSFVALMALAVGQRVTGARTLPGRLLSAAGAGALILTLADLVAQVALPGIVLPAGVMTGALGAPYLLWRLSREMERGTT
jgi:iron complex transport system permease protein